ncbi:MAG: VCBS repeat-containing protein [Sphingobacteriales bacterium]
MRIHHLLTYLFIVVLMMSCGKKEQDVYLFDLLGPEQTGIQFTNKLTPRGDLNMLKYMYFYNGAGVATGDWNNDGKIDIFFTANQMQNRLYLNKGDLQFEDITKTSGIPDDGGWSNGVSVVDINNDGRLDLYVCRVGNYASLKSRNQLLVCTGIDEQGIPHYEDQAIQYGLDFSGFSTQAAFFDYDLDGDLDMYLMNHSLRYNSTFQPREKLMNTYDSLSGDRMYRNDKGYFTDVTRASGINSSAIGYGLGITISDINYDGYPDVYIANDFHENDYLYINQKDGSFKDELSERIDHTSQFSMGVDIADVNNDAHPDIITLDMLPEDPYILKRSLGEDEYNLYKMKLRYGYAQQYTRNQLQLNRGDGTFSEIGFYSGIAASDWSWASLWMDFDHDGQRDLFISNGIPRRLNDIDYVNYISNDVMQERIRSDKMDIKDFAFLEKFPQIKLENKFFVNKGKVSFTDASLQIRNNRSSFSNGSAYADFDNDGDLDVVVNNIDDPAYIYRNNSNDKRYISVRMRGDTSNLRAIGAKLVVFCGTEKLIADKYPVKGFQSSMEVPLQLGLGNRHPDSIWLIWPDLRYQKLDTAKRDFAIQYSKGLPKVDLNLIYKNEPLPFIDLAVDRGLHYVHEENDYVEFNREPLLPFMLSMEGPALAVGDMNNDGLDDVFFGSSRGNRSALYLQDAQGKFFSAYTDIFQADSLFEDIDALWSDINRDGYKDLIVAGSGNEYYGADTLMHPRIYINDGGKRLIRKGRITGIQFTVSCLRSADINGDGVDDLFIGSRTKTFGYGTIPESYLLLNDGKGNFVDVTDTWMPGLKQLGMVKDAVWVDLDGDKDLDLAIALEWGGVEGFIREGNGFQKKPISVKKGWWNTIKAVDIDRDGDQDLLLGNQGENSRIRPTIAEPVRMYYDDVDGNGLKEQLVTYYLKGQEIPFAGKGELDKQIPSLKKTFLYAGDYAKADVRQIFGSDKLNKAKQFTAETFSHICLLNRGKMNFEEQTLPYFTQWSCYRDFLIFDYNADGLNDIMPGGNFYGDAIAMGRNDAEHGSVWLNKGNGNWELTLLPSGMLSGQVRRLQKIRMAGGVEGIIGVRNGGKISLLIKK